MAASGSRPEFSIIRSMKRPGLTPHLLSATLFLLPGSWLTVCAQDMMAAKSTKRAEELLKRFDKNADGKLDDDERADAKEAMMKEQIDRQMTRATAIPGSTGQFRTQALEMFDQNRDGRLDGDERAVARKFAESQQGSPASNEEWTKRFDKNGDGRIDPEERAQIDAYLRELRDFGSSQIREELLRLFDRNANGKIDDGEMTDVEVFVRPHIEANPFELRRHDKNNDGKLDGEEWITARAAILQWLNAAGPPVLETDAMRGEFELATLRRVAAEIARRRAEREGPVGALVKSVEGKTNAEIEQARLQAVAEEVARRRSERAGTPAGTTTK